MDYSRHLSELAATAADEKKACAIALLDLQSVSLMADYFVLCSGSSAIAVRAIADHIIERLEAEGYQMQRREGMTEGRWVLLDFGVVVVHIMQDREREYYGLERLWSQGRLVPFQAASA